MLTIHYLLLLSILAGLFFHAHAGIDRPSQSASKAPQDGTSKDEIVEQVQGQDGLGRKIFIPVFRYKKKAGNRRRVQKQS